MAETPEPKPLYSSWRKALPWVLFAFALGIRLVGISWGLKNDLHNPSYHPDEAVIFGYSRAIVPGQGQFVPHFYNYGTLYLTLLRISSDITTTYSGGPKTQPGWSWTNPEATDWDWVSRCDLSGRIISAVAGAGTALAVFFLALRFLDVLGASIAGFALAIAPAHIIHSKFQTVDVLATFFIAMSTLYALKLLPGREEGPPDAKLGLKFAALAGVFAGLSGGTKYTGILALLTLFAAIGLARRPTWLREAAIGGLAALAAFVASTPGFVLDSSKFWQDFAYEMQHTATGHGFVFAGTAPGYLFHIVNLLVGMGPLLTVVSVLALLWAGFRRHYWALALLAFVIPYYALIAKAEVKFLRYTFPLYVALATAFGYAFETGWRKKKGIGQATVGVSMLALGGIPYGGLRGAVETMGYMAGQDPRDAALRYLRAQKPKSVGLIVDPWYWSVPLFPDAPEPRSVPWPLRLAQLQTQSDPPAAFALAPDGSPTQLDVRLPRDMKPETIAYTSLEYDPVDRLVGLKGLAPDQQGMANQAADFKQALESNYTLEATFGTSMLRIEDLEYIQPTVYVWRLKTAH